MIETLLTGLVALLATLVSAVLKETSERRRERRFSSIATITSPELLARFRLAESELDGALSGISVAGGLIFPVAAHLLWRLFLQILNPSTYVLAPGALLAFLPHLVFGACLATHLYTRHFLARLAVDDPGLSTYFSAFYRLQHSWQVTFLSPSFFGIAFLLLPSVLFLPLYTAISATTISTFGPHPFTRVSYPLSEIENILLVELHTSAKPRRGPSYVFLRDGTVLVSSGSFPSLPGELYDLGRRVEVAIGRLSSDTGCPVLRIELKPDEVDTSPQSLLARVHRPPRRPGA